MKQKLENFLRNPLVTLGLITVVIFLLCLMIFGAQASTLNIEIGDKKISVSKPNLIMSYKEFGEAVREIALIPDYREEEQETHLDNIAESINRIILDHHVKLLEIKGMGKDCYANKEYKSYAHTTAICLGNMKLKAISDFKKMNFMFTEKNINEFEVFAKTCVVKYISEYGDMVKREWVDLGISSDENYEWTRTIVPEIAAKITEIMKLAFSVQIKYMQKFQELNNKTIIIQSNSK